jgi:hypothetical protein
MQSVSLQPALRLDFSKVEHQSRLLADLLKAGIQKSGWASVAKLELKVRSCEAGVLETRRADRL